MIDRVKETEVTADARDAMRATSYQKEMQLAVRSVAMGALICWSLTHFFPCFYVNLSYKSTNTPLLS